MSKVKQPPPAPPPGPHEAITIPDPEDVLAPVNYGAFRALVRVRRVAAILADARNLSQSSIVIDGSPVNVPMGFREACIAFMGADPGDGTPHQDKPAGLVLSRA